MTAKAYDAAKTEAKIDQLQSDLAAEKRAKEEAERERDSWKAVCRKAGVCMSCAIAMPDPHGCFDCLNTGWEGGAPKAFAPEKIVTPLHSDGEPLSMEGAIAANRPCATHCTVCEGEDHHWLDECADEGDPIQVCKHCNAWRPFGDDADD